MSDGPTSDRPTNEDAASEITDSGSAGDPMSDLLDILVCPKSKGELRLVELPSAVCDALIDRYREHFQDERPEVRNGLLCDESGLLYPIVSDIPVMLVEEALPASVLDAS